MTAAWGRPAANSDGCRGPRIHGAVDERAPPAQAARSRRESGREPVQATGRRLLFLQGDASRRAVAIRRCLQTGMWSARACMPRASRAYRCGRGERGQLRQWCSPYSSPGSMARAEAAGVAPRFRSHCSVLPRRIPRAPGRPGPSNSIAERAVLDATGSGRDEGDLREGTCGGWFQRCLWGTVVTCTAFLTISHFSLRPSVPGW
jgi:hypothetical protein